MAIVDALNKVTGGHGATIEEAVKNLQQGGGGGGSNDIVYTITYDETLQDNVFTCNKTAIEAVELLKNNPCTNVYIYFAYETYGFAGYFFRPSYITVGANYQNSSYNLVATCLDQRVNATTFALEGVNAYVYIDHNNSGGEDSITGTFYIAD